MLFFFFKWRRDKEAELDSYGGGTGIARSTSIDSCVAMVRDVDTDVCVPFVAHETLGSG